MLDELEFCEAHPGGLGPDSAQSAWIQQRLVSSGMLSFEMWPGVVIYLGGY